MSVTATRFGNQQAHIIGALRMTITDVALDSSYPSGGEPLTAANLGLAEVFVAIPTLKTAATSTVNQTQAYYDVANSKLVVYDETPAEVTGDLDGIVYRVVAFGR